MRNVSNKKSQNSQLISCVVWRIDEILLTKIKESNSQGNHENGSVSYHPMAKKFFYELADWPNCSTGYGIWLVNIRDNAPYQ